MNSPKIIGIGVVFLLVGILLGYLYWGQQSGRLATELASARARLADSQKVEDRQREMEAKLKEAQAGLQKATEDLEFERKQREGLQLLLSKGRK